MENLMSMTDFVLLGWNDNQINIRYANFLKQPLEIWQFVPCKLVDGVWVILEEPEIHLCFDNQEYDELYKEYQEAKERCLFEGFHYNSPGYVTDGVFKFNKEYFENKTIEDLVKYKPKLTATAKKQIGF